MAKVFHKSYFKTNCFTY